jgi:hypothetical protein
MNATIIETKSGTFEVWVGEILMGTKDTQEAALDLQRDLAKPGAFIDPTDGFDWSYFDDNDDTRK